MSKTRHNIKYSIIIPEWPKEIIGNRPFGIDHIEQLDYPKEQFEIIISRGYQVCRQRNLAAKQANGEILVFFDNDSCPESDYLKQLEPHFNTSEITAVGGPNPALKTNKFIPNLVDAVLTSRVAVLSKVNRYKPIGHLRVGKDSDLIFCNFSMRREDYLELDGLHEALSPNEENEFFERIAKNLPDKKVLYDPNLIAYEPRSTTLKAFFKKMLGYGIGRARQFKISPSFWSAIHLSGCLIPFVLVAIGLARKGVYLKGIIIPYIMCLLCSMTHYLMTKKRWGITLFIPITILSTHLAYIFGMWIGIFSSKKTKADQGYPVKIERFKP